MTIVKAANLLIFNEQTFSCKFSSRESRDWRDQTRWELLAVFIESRLLVKRLRREAPLAYELHSFPWTLNASFEVGLRLASLASRVPLALCFPILRSFCLSLSDHRRSVANECSPSFSLSVWGVYFILLLSVVPLRCSLADLCGSRQGRREPRRHVLCPPGSLAFSLSV